MILFSCIPLVLHLPLRRGCAQGEVRAIVAKRKEFEYLLRRFETRKMDFMRYVEYETNLDSLRARRTKRLGKERGKQYQFASSDASCVRLIRSTFDRAVQRFPADVDIWLQYIDFAAQRKQTKVRVR